MLPLLLWLAARCQPAFAMAGAFIVSIIAIYAAIFGIGHFGDAAMPMVERAQGTQATVMMVTAYTLVLTALLTERRLREERLHRLLGALPAAIHTTDTAGRITFCNKAAVDLWGINPELGKDKCSDLGRLYYPDGTLMPPDQCPTGLCLTERRAIEGREAVFERTDGKRIAIVPYPAPLTDEEGEVVGVVSMKIDISERKRAEAALAERDAQFALAGKVALVGCHTYDCLSGITTLSPGCAAIYGLSEGIVELSSDESRALMHPEDLARLEVEFRQAYGLQQSEVVSEFRILRADNGEVRWIEARNIVAYDDTGRPLRMTGVSIDVTERKKAELALAERDALIGLAEKVTHVGNFTVELNTGRVQLSAGCVAIHGFPEGTAEVRRDDWRAGVHPDDLARLNRLFSQAFAERLREYKADYRIIRSGGEVRWIETRALISYDRNGRPERFVGVNIDVTERKRAEEHLQAMNAELDHRVKNVLATASAIAAQTLNASSSLEHFVSAFDGRLRSMAQTHELLSERLWRGIPLAALLRRELAPYAGGNNTEIGGPEVILSAEAGQTLAMVFHELATNAAKHGAFSSREGTVSVDWRRQLNGNAHAGLVIEWQETGGPPAKAESKAGYGISVICELVPHELAGKVNHVLTPEGARCQLELPGRWIDASSTN